MDKIFKLNKGDIIYVDLGHHSDSSVQSGKHVMRNGLRQHFIWHSQLHFVLARYLL